MIFTKPKPIGLDVKIQQLQVALDGHFAANTAWNLTRNGYGRVYRNNTIKSTYLPQAYKGGKEYTPSIFFEDTVAYQTFFDIGETITINPKNGCSSAKVQLYFFGDLSKIYPSATDRNDEQAINFIMDFVNNKYGFFVTGVTRGVKKCLSDYTGPQKEKALTYDMQPRLCFRIEMEIPNYPNCFNVPFTYIGNAFVPFVRNQPSGIDYWIDRLQNEMFNFILRALAIPNTQYNCYPRIYRNKTGQKDYLPYGYSGSNQYTKPILFDDNFIIQSFFDIGESNTVEQVGVSSANVQLYFFADLNKIYNVNGGNNVGNTYRMDMELLETICQFVNNKYGFMVLKKVIGVKEMFKDYTGVLRNTTLMHDMQPFYCFRLDMVKYNYNTALDICPARGITDTAFEFNPNEFNSNQFS